MSIGNVVFPQNCSVSLNSPKNPHINFRSHSEKYLFQEISRLGLTNCSSQGSCQKQLCTLHAHSLEQLKILCPYHFNEIFNQIIRHSCNHAEWQSLKQELKSNIREKVKEYFPLALMDSDHFQAFQSELGIIANNRENRLHIYTALRELFDSAFDSDRNTVEKKLQDCFIQLVNPNADREELIVICKIILKLFPHFSIPKSLQDKLASNSYLLDRKRTQFADEKEPILYYVLPLVVPDGTDLPELKINRPLAMNKILQLCEDLLRARKTPPEKLQISSLDKVFLQDPENVCALRCRAEHFYAQRLYADACNDFNRVLHYLPDDSDALIKRAICLAETRQIDAALADLTQVGQLKPFDLLTFMLRAECHLQKSNFENAVRDCNWVLKEEPHQFHALVIRAESLYQLGDISASIKDFKRAYQLNPKDTYAIEGLHKCLELLEF